MNAIVAFVVAVLVIGLCFWAVQRLLQAFKVGEPIASIVIVVFVLLVVVWLAGLLRGRPFLWG